MLVGLRHTLTVSFVLPKLGLNEGPRTLTIRKSRYRLRYFDPLRGVAKGLYTDTGDNKKGGYSCGKVELILDEGVGGLQ